MSSSFTGPDDGGGDHSRPWSTQDGLQFRCRLCGQFQRAPDSVVLDYWLEFGCEDCLRNVNQRAKAILQEVFTPEELNARL